MVDRMDASIDGIEDGEGTARRACDQCRVRKIRCDKTTPCSNCMTAKRACSSTGAGQKIKEPRQRVLISTQYERKIDQIEQRLGRIELLLRNLPGVIQGAQQSQSPESGASGGRAEADWAAGGSAPAGTATSTAVLGDPAAVAPVASLGATPPTGSSLVGDCSRSVTLYGEDEDDYEEAESPFEGDSSMTAHTVFASEFLHHAVGRTSLNPSAVMNPSMHAALSSLQQIVHMQRKGSSTLADIRFPNQKAMPRGGFRELPMPPLQVVVGILREIKGNSSHNQVISVTFSLLAAFIGAEEYTEHCRRVYFATEDYSQASYIITNAGLYYIFQEKAAGMGLTPLGREYERYTDMCRDNLETALAHFNLLQPARRENVEALLLGSSYAVEIAKPSLAWQLNSAACNLCLTMGYHRATPPPFSSSPSSSSTSISTSTSTSTRIGAEGAAPEEVQAGKQQHPAPEEKAATKRQVMFWLAYMLDKGLALRLGRASVLQDYDITAPRRLGRLKEFDEFRGPMTAWVQHAEVQGRIYEDLYSPTALQRPVEQRVRTAQACIAELRRMAGALSATHGTFSAHALGSQFSADIVEMLLKSDEISILSSLTLVYRAIPPDASTFPGGVSSTFNSECIEVAREAVEAHMVCMHMLQASRELAAAYLHWTILYSPFVPFIVIFCHVIETFNASDLRRLQQFVASLEGPRHVSEPVNKLHRLFNALANVATMYVETKSQQPEDQAMFPVSNEFDIYLRDLGFMPGPGGGDGAMVGASAPGGAAAAVSGGGGVGAVTASSGSGVPASTTMEIQNAQLGDWFSGNLSMIGMLEQDLSQFSPSAWPPADPVAHQHQQQ